MMKCSISNPNVGRLVKLNCILLLHITLVFFSKSAVAQNKQPNIILIMADDLGYETIEANGGRSYATPGINRMAKEGMRFTNAHSTPLCSPSRIQLMTGKYNHRNYPGFGIIDTTEITFGHLLKAAGYRTGIAGKWQLYGNDIQQNLVGHRGSLPQEMGFDDYFLWNVDYTNREWRYKNPTIYSNNGKKIYPGKYGPDLFFNWCKDFISSNKQSPFFLYYPMVLTHDPFQPTPGHVDYKGSIPASKGDTVYFRSMVQYMDSIVDQLIQHVRKEGIAEETIIIFTGDNGTKNSIVSNFNGTKFRGGKGSTKVAGTHVPFVVLWDGRIKANSINHNLVDFTDLLPTMMDVVGAKIPKDFKTDGISLYGQLLNKNHTKVRDAIFCYYDPKWGNVKKSVWIHNKEWKLYETGEYYNILKDPLELKPILDHSLTKKEQLIKQNLKRDMTRILKN